MKRLGEILIEQGAIIPKQLETALDRQKKAPEKLLGQLLIEMGYVSDTDIVSALSTQFNIPYLPIANYSVDINLIRQIPKELMIRHHFIPIERNGPLLSVVIADPTNEAALQEIEEATKCKIRVFVATIAEIEHVMNQHLSGEKYPFAVNGSAPQSPKTQPPKPTA